MSKTKTHPIGIEIDRLTNSILNTISGDSFPTEIAELTKADLKTLQNWQFDWKSEWKQTDRTVWKLTIVGNPKIIQGLVSLRDLGDHVFLNLIESAPFNLGKKKLYEGVPGNLFAFACKQSLEKGYEGFVVFLSKTKLIGHYETTLRATNVGGLKMILFPDAADFLIKKYFP